MWLPPKIRQNRDSMALTPSGRSKFRNLVVVIFCYLISFLPVHPAQQPPLMKRTESTTTNPEKKECQRAREVRSDSDASRGSTATAPNDRDMVIRRIQSAPVSRRVSRVIGHGGKPSCIWCIVAKCECLCDP
jgi:hypothetical protein